MNQQNYSECSNYNQSSLDMIIEHWSPVLNEGAPISNPYTARTTACILENTLASFTKKPKLGSMFSEATIGNSAGILGGNGISLGQVGTGYTSAGTDFSTANQVVDSRLPNVIIPTLRRIFPELIAHDIVGVQAMSAPVGQAFALRYLYGKKGTNNPSTGKEVGYNYIDSTFTGADGLAAQDTTKNYASGSYPGFANTGAGPVPTEASDPAAKMWSFYKGTDSTTVAGAYGSNVNGIGASINSSEFWAIGDEMPMADFRIEKGMVEAKERKLAAHWSLELEEDMAGMFGINTDSEFVNVLSYEIKAETDRQLSGEVTKSAIVGGNFSTWTPEKADGRHQLERLGTLYTHILLKSQDISVKTRRGSATFALASANTVGVLERLKDYALDAAGKSQVSYGANGVAFAGTMRQGTINVYRDTFAQNDYITLGFKGINPYDTGIVYCPYIPVSFARATSQEDFSPRIGVRTRYGILHNLFGSSNYYHFIALQDLMSVITAGKTQFLMD